MEQTMSEIIIEAYNNSNDYNAQANKKASTNFKQMKQTMSEIIIEAHTSNDYNFQANRQVSIKF